ncbi:MAG: hypothetical protein R8K21_06445 [Mariprofundales bacterium]
MFAFVYSICCLLLMTINISSTGLWPDWSFALLMAAVLTRRYHAVWAIPMLLLHDIILYANIFAFWPWLLLMLVVEAYSDIIIGPSIPQRILVLIVSPIPLLWHAHEPVYILTILACLPLWSALVVYDIGGNNSAADSRIDIA